jgi:hypothetical protein
MLESEDKKRAREKNGRRATKRKREREREGIDAIIVPILR